MIKSIGYNPGCLSISKVKINNIIKTLHLNNAYKKNIKHNMKLLKSILKEGDTSPAKVVSVNPLLIAVYSDNFDAVIILKFDDYFLNEYFLTLNQKLVCSSFFIHKEVFDVEPDIIPGIDYDHTFRDILPIISLFVTDDIQKCNALIDIFPEEIWDYMDTLIEDYFVKKPDTYRNGLKVLIGD